MSGGEAFVIQAAVDMAARERRARRKRSTTSEWSPFFGSTFKIHKPAVHPGLAGSEPRPFGGPVVHSWIELLIVVVAALVVMLMVAGGGIAFEHSASAAALEAAPGVSVPDSLMLCSTVDERTTCVREPT